MKVYLQEQTKMVIFVSDNVCFAIRLNHTKNVMGQINEIRKMYMEHPDTLPKSALCKIFKEDFPIKVNDFKVDPAIKNAKFPFTLIEPPN